MMKSTCSFRVCLSVAVVSFAAMGASVHPLDAYVQDDSLIAWWDGEYNSLVDGKPVHKTDATQWDSLVSGAEAFQSDSLDYCAQSVVYRGKRLPTTIDSMPQVRTTPVTVQIVARCVVVENLGQSHQLFSTWHGDLGLKGNTFTFAGSAWNSQFSANLKTSMTNLQVNTFVFSSDGFCLYENLDQLENKSSMTGQPKPSTGFTIGSSRETRCQYEYFAIRIYARELSKDEILQNLVADMNRLGFSFDGVLTSPVPRMNLPLPVTQDSYAQNGLYAQWDGICNATNGGPHHSENPTQWDDLKGNATAFASQDVLTFESNRVSVSKATPTSIAWLAGDPREWTMELATYCSYNAKNGSMDTMLFGSCGGLAYYSEASKITGGAPALNGQGKYQRYEITGPSVTGETPHTYSLSLYVDDFATLSIDGVGTAIAKGRAKDLVDKTDSVLRLGSERPKPSAFDFYSIRIYDRPLSAEEQERNSFIDKVRFFGMPYELKLIVTGEPRCYGTVTPGYGDYCGLKEGDVVAFSAQTNSVQREFLGYEVRTNGIDGAWHTMSRGKESTLYLLLPKARTKVIWRWKSPGLMLILK